MHNSKYKTANKSKTIRVNSKSTIASQSNKQEPNRKGKIANKCQIVRANK